MVSNFENNDEDEWGSSWKSDEENELEELRSSFIKILQITSSMVDLVFEQAKHLAVVEADCNLMKIEIKKLNKKLAENPQTDSEK